MKFKDSRISGSNQLQWVVLLLAVAVVLPTVCLVWFMTQAVRNERLVVRQKMMDVYKGQMDLLGRQMDDLWADRTRFLDTVARSNLAPAAAFVSIVEASGNNRAEPFCSGIVIFEANGRLLYPIVDKESDASGRPPEEIAEAWKAEFVENEPLKAAQIYSQVAQMRPDSYTGRLALMGKIRCLNKAGEIEKAIRECQKLAYEDTQQVLDPASAALISQARLQIVALRKKTPAGLTRADVVALVDSAINYTGDSANGFLPLSSNSRIFFLSQTLEILRESPWAGELKAKSAVADKLLAAEQNTAAALDLMNGSISSVAITKDSTQNLITTLQTVLVVIEKSEWSERLNIDANQVKVILAAAQNSNASPVTTAGPLTMESRPRHRLHKLGAGSNLLGLYHNTPGRVFLFLSTPELLRSDLSVIGDKLTKLGLSYRITDDAGAYIAGLKQTEEKPFMASAMGQYLPGWQIALFADQTSAFEKAAGKRISLYIWTGVLVIILILLAGAFAAQAVRKQIRLNKMKNDFIATVSHELKTPLASMRVLVDTILEGNVKDEAQTTEYLRLTAKENQRLSRMIDNFLTFSRMERNKKVFTLTDAKPASIAADAVEAVKPKFATHNCHLAVEIADNLPEVHADHDAIVTVLVNLLDNACKYTSDDKQISLKVFTENNNISFAVSDNGIGLARRHIRRIFDSFYQVDTTLSRTAEGCGLGLSIVKFIVDAHKGEISVESKLGKGSTFTVKIPLSARVTD